MRFLSTFFIFVTLIATGCVPAERYEELQAKHNELAQDLATTKHKLDAAQEDHLKATDRYEQEIHNLREQLTAEQRRANELDAQIKQLQKDYDAATAAASQSAKDNLKLLDEKKELNDSIIELKGTILTLQDRIKDLETRLAEQLSRTEPEASTPEAGP